MFVWGYNAPAWRSVLLHDPCVYCGERATTEDHIKPRVFGGAAGWFNIAPACASCNNAKGHTPLLLFLCGQRFVGPVQKINTPGQEWNRRRRERPELPPPPPLTFTLAELFCA